MKRKYVPSLLKSAIKMTLKIIVWCLRFFLDWLYAVNEVGISPTAKGFSHYLVVTFVCLHHPHCMLEDAVLSMAQIIVSMHPHCVSDSGDWIVCVAYWSAIEEALTLCSKTIYLVYTCIQGRWEDWGGAGQIQKVGPRKMDYVRGVGSTPPGNFEMLHALQCVCRLLRLFFMHAHSKYIPASCRLRLTVSDQRVWHTGP